MGNYLGVSLEVDQQTISKEIITHGRVKVMLGRVKKLPAQIPLWLGDLQIWVVAKEDQQFVAEEDQEIVYPNPFLDVEGGDSSS